MVVVILSGLFYILPGDQQLLPQGSILILIILGLGIPLALQLIVRVSGRHEAPDYPEVAHDLLRDFQQRLITVEDPDELTEVMIQCVRAIFPLVGASFLVYDPNLEGYELTKEWSIDSRPLPQPRPLHDMDGISIEMISQFPSLGFFIPGSRFSASSNFLAGDSSVASSQTETIDQDQLNCFCLPLPFGDSQVAVFNLFFPSRAVFTSEQITCLNEVALDMTMAIERVQLRRMIMAQNAAIKAEHNRLARHLHDTLGQNLAYLRLRLDQISGDDALNDIAAIKEELERMREIADQAYEEVRSSLSELRDDPLSDLTNAVADYANQIGDRAVLQIQIRTEGKPRTLTGKVRRQTLYILRETLRNIEKHASAQQVTIAFAWHTDDLTVIVQDDGRGFELTPGQTVEGHYGLKIIQERAKEIDAQVLIDSAVNSGTQLTLVIPFQPAL